MPIVAVTRRVYVFFLSIAAGTIHRLHDLIGGYLDQGFHSDRPLWRSNRSTTGWPGPAVTGRGPRLELPGDERFVFGSEVAVPFTEQAVAAEVAVLQSCA